MSDKIEKLSELDLQFNAYAKSNYTYNDAELLASLWNIDIVDAKKTIGYKIINKIEHLLPEKIIGGSGKFESEERKYDLPALGTFVLSPYTYSDAEKLAELWEIGVVDAKELIGIKVMYGNEDLLPEEVRIVGC